MAGPMFTEVGGPEQAAHELFIRSRTTVREKCVQLFRSWWQAGDHEAQTTQQRDAICTRCGHEPGSLYFSQDKTV